MAKRKKRKLKRRKEAGAADPHELLEIAEKELAAGKTRRAREGFRRLFKLEPDRFRERYIEVTLRYIEERLELGRIREARQLVEHLDEIGASEPQLKTTRLQIAAQEGNPDEVAEAASELLHSDQAAERQSAADALVVAQADEAMVVCNAISQMCRGEWEAMQASLREIGRKSPFAHWRLFLRGCAAFYGGDGEGAERCFQRLPAGSLPARKAGAFRLLNGEWRGANAKTIAEACLLTGEPKLAKSLSTAEEKWKERRFLEAYRTIGKSERYFPCVEVSLQGQLTRFFQLADRNMEPVDLDRWLTPLFAKFNPKRNRIGDAESYLLSNAFSRHVSENPEERDVTDMMWDLLRMARERLLGESPRFTAICFLTRASWFEADLEDDYLPAGERDELGEGAIVHLETAVDADPSFLEPGLRLLAVYRRLRRFPEAYRLLDALSDRFPESKEVLLAAGTAAIERKSFVKAQSFLERARTIDPIDPAVRTEIRRCLRGKALQHFRKGTKSQLDRGRAAFEALLGSVPASPPLGEGRSYLLVDWAVAEEFAGNSKMAEERFAQAREELSFDTAQFYRALQRKRLSSLFPSKNQRSVSSRLPKLKASRARVREAVTILKLWAIARDDVRGPFFLDAVGWIERYAKAAARKMQAGDREAALELASQGVSGSFRRQDWLGILVKQMLAQDKHDPHYRCLAWEHGILDRPSREELAEAKEEARRRRDRAALEALTRLEGVLANQPPFDDDTLDDPLGGIFYGEDTDEDEDEEDLPPEEMDFDREGASEAELDSVLASLSPELAELLGRLSLQERRNFFLGAGLTPRESAFLAEAVASQSSSKKQKSGTSKRKSRQLDFPF